MSININNIVFEQSIQINELVNKNFFKREYDQVTKQNVIISYDEIKKRYRFEIQKPENDVYLYQIWKKKNEVLNTNRKYYYEKLRDWVIKFKEHNVKYNFKPTTLIEINDYFPTVLVDASIDTRDGIDYCVLYFENKTIKPLQGIINEIPKSGLFSNVRFDIDAAESQITKKLRVQMKLDDGFIVFDGYMNLISVDTNYNLLWAMTSMEDKDGNIYKLDYNQSDFYYGGGGNGPYPTPLQDINRGTQSTSNYSNNYNFVNRPYVISYYTAISGQNIVRYGLVENRNPSGKYVIYEIKDDTDVVNKVNNILLFNSSEPSYQGVFNLTNQVLYYDKISLKYKTITTATNGQTININDGKYYINGNISPDQDQSNNSYDINSGVIFSGYAIDTNKQIIKTNSSYNTYNNGTYETYYNTFKFWYSSLNNGWNFMSSNTFNSADVSQNWNTNLVGAGPSFKLMNTNQQLGGVLLSDNLTVTFAEVADTVYLSSIQYSNWIASGSVIGIFGIDIYIYNLSITNNQVTLKTTFNGSDTYRTGTIDFNNNKIFSQYNLDLDQINNQLIIYGFDSVGNLTFFKQ
jgi:hypothetical protein